MRNLSLAVTLCLASGCGWLGIGKDEAAAPTPTTPAEETTTDTSATYGFLYVANLYGTSIDGFRLSEAGLLTPLSFEMPAGDTPYRLALTPDQKFLYIANFGTETITICSVNSETGELTLVGTQAFDEDDSIAAAGLTADPLGRFLYVATSGDSEKILAFEIDSSTGALTELSSTELLNVPGSSIGNMVASADGAFLYASSAAHVTLYAFSVSDEGVLTELSDSPYEKEGIYDDPSGWGVMSHAISPDSDFIYWLQANTPSSIAGFALSADGTLGDLLDDMPLAPRESEVFRDMVLSPDGLHLYAIQSDSGDSYDWVEWYSRDPVTGALTQPQNAPYFELAGGGPTDLAIDPRGAFLFVNALTHDAIRVFTIDPETGALGQGWAEYATQEGASDLVLVRASSSGGT